MRLIPFLLPLMTLVLPARARLGKTEDQAVARYGQALNEKNAVFEGIPID
jgi:hypothetical protein